MSAPRRSAPPRAGVLAAFALANVLPATSPVAIAQEPAAGAAPTRTDPDASGAAAIREALARLLATPALAGARIGVCVHDLADATLRVEHDAEHGFMTASNMKLITAATALATLGPDFTFATRVVAAGEPQDGVIDGDLWLVGDGDPTFGSWRGGDPMRDPRALAKAIYDRGVRTVTGRVLGSDDCQADEHLGRGWQFDYLEDDYAAPFGGLCFAENVCELVLAGTRAGEPPAVWQRPTIGDLEVGALPRCGEPGSRTTLRVQRPPYSTALRVGGAIAADQKPQAIRVAVADPTLYAARALHRALREQGVTVLGAAGDADQAGAPAPPSGSVLAEHRSAPLAAIVRPLLKVSDNLYAEQLLRTAARKAGAGSRSAEAEAHAKTVLAAMGVTTERMQLADGSGLSRRNLVAPAQIVALLRAAWLAPWREPFVAGLPIAGVDGTLRNRFQGSAARGVAIAKTGFIGHVACLSGYVPGPDPVDAPLVFSVMLNNFTCDDGAAKAAIDAFVDALARASGHTAAR